MPNRTVEIDAPVGGRGAWMRELGAVLALSWPIVLTNLTQIGMGTTDVVMMGWLGPEALAAGSLGSNLYFVALLFGIGLLNATSPMIAHAVGRDAGDVGDVRRTVQQSFWAATCIALPAWCVLWWGEALLVAIGQEPALAAAAGSYLRWLQWGILPFLFYLVLRSFVAALERPGWSLAIGAAAMLVNGGANWCLLLGRCGFEGMGLAGSGLATALSSLFMAVALGLVASLDPQFRRYRLFAGWWRTDWPRFRAVLRLGLPLAATLSFEMTIFSAAVFLMGLLGAAELAAHAIAIQVAVVSFMVPLGIGQAATVRVGIARGAGDAAAVGRAGWAAFALGIAFAVTTSAVMATMPAALVGIFIDAADPANARVVALAKAFLVVAALFQLVDAAQAVGSGMLRGLQDVRLPMLYALLGYWGIGLPVGVILAFPLQLGGVGIWIGLASGLAVVAVLMIRRWTHRGLLGTAGG